MKVGDVVMFADSENRYSNWFFGEYGIVKSYTAVGRTNGQSSCRVGWLRPVPYFDSYSTISDFPAIWFEVSSENR
jgi:hypothetical protein